MGSVGKDAKQLQAEKLAKALAWAAMKLEEFDEVQDHIEKWFEENSSTLRLERFEDERPKMGRRLFSGIEKTFEGNEQACHCIEMVKAEMEKCAYKNACEVLKRVALEQISAFC